MSGSDAIIRKSDIEARRDVEGHGSMTIYSFARPGTNSRWLHVTLNEIEEGGGIEPHYHEGVEFDHAYYVLEGEVIARVGDHEERIGSDSLICSPVRRSTASAWSAPAAPRSSGSARRPTASRAAATST